MGTSLCHLGMKVKARLLSSTCEYVLLHVKNENPVQEVV